MDNDEMVVGTDFMGDVDLRQQHPHHAGTVTTTSNTTANTTTTTTTITYY